MSCTGFTRQLTDGYELQVNERVVAQVYVAKTDWRFIFSSRELIKCKRPPFFLLRFSGHGTTELYACSCNNHTEVIFSVIRTLDLHFHWRYFTVLLKPALLWVASSQHAYERKIIYECIPEWNIWSSWNN